MIGFPFLQPVHRQRVIRIFGAILMNIDHHQRQEHLFRFDLIDRAKAFDEVRRRINVRKKDYIHFVEGMIADAQRAKGSKGSVSPRAAALALLGMINWIYQWYKPEGRLQAQDLIPQYTEILFSGAFQ